MTYNTGKKEGIIQVLERLLPVLPYKNVQEALWELRDEPYIGEGNAVDWILEYYHPTVISYMHIDVERADCTPLASMYVGEVIALLKQNFPLQNGIYVYTGHLQPLKKVSHDYCG